MREQHTPALDTQQIGKYAGQEAQSTRAPTWWVVIQSINLDGSADDPKNKALCRTCDPLGTNAGQDDRAVTLVQAHQPGDVILVCAPIGGTKEGHGGKTITWQEVAGGLPPGGTQYQVLQRPDNTQTGAVWDWVRAHDTPP